MALITCTGCGERISSQYAHCPHCGQATNPEIASSDAVTVPARQQKKLRQRTQDLSHLALLAMVAGSIWYYIDSQGLKQPAGDGPIWLMGAGASLYLYLRIWWLLRRLRQRGNDQ